MDDKTKQAALNQLYADQASIMIKMSAISLAGSIAGVSYSVHKGYGFWAGAGYFILGSIVAQIPLAIAFSNKRTKIAANILTLQQELNATRPSLMETLKSQYNLN